MSKEEILERYRDDSNFPNMNTVVFFRSDALEAMEEYAKEEMINLITNISHQPIQCYSEKVRGQDRQFYLGRSYVEDLIKRIKESK